MLAARSSIAPAVDLDVDLDVFVGPFDLLVTLILKDEVDLWEVRVSRIIAEYVVRLADTGQFDLESTSQFVVLIAALLEMKSRLLAEDEVRDELDEPDAAEAGEELLAALVRYSQYKGAAAALRELWSEHADRMYRHVALPSRYARADDIGTAASRRSCWRVDWRRCLAEPAVPDASHIADLAVTLVRELRRLRALLADSGPLTFAAVAPRDRLEKAITFFALLELHSRGEVTLEQRHAFGEINDHAAGQPADRRSKRSGDAGRRCAVRCRGRRSRTRWKISPDTSKHFCSLLHGRCRSLSWPAHVRSTKPLCGRACWSLRPSTSRAAMAWLWLR